MVAGRTPKRGLLRPAPLETVDASCSWQEFSPAHAQDIPVKNTFIEFPGTVGDLSCDSRPSERPFTTPGCWTGTVTSSLSSYQRDEAQVTPSSAASTVQAPPVDTALTELEGRGRPLVQRYSGRTPSPSPDMYVANAAAIENLSAIYAAAASMPELAGANEPTPPQKAYPASAPSHFTPSNLRRESVPFQPAPDLPFAPAAESVQYSPNDDGRPELTPGVPYTPNGVEGRPEFTSGVPYIPNGDGRPEFTQMPVPYMSNGDGPEFTPMPVSYSPNADREFTPMNFQSAMATPPMDVFSPSTQMGHMLPSPGANPEQVFSPATQTGQNVYTSPSMVGNMPEPVFSPHDQDDRFQAPEPPHRPAPQPEPAEEMRFPGWSTPAPQRARPELQTPTSAPQYERGFGGQWESSPHSFDRPQAQQTSPTNWDSDPAPRWDEWRKPLARDVSDRWEENRRWDGSYRQEPSPAGGKYEWRDAHFDTAPARTHQYDAPERRRELWGDRWRRDEPSRFSRQPRRSDVRIPEVSSVLPAPVLPKPAPAQPAPEPVVSRVNIKFSYKVNSGPTEKAPDEPENAPEKTPECEA